MSTNRIKNDMDNKFTLVVRSKKFKDKFHLIENVMGYFILLHIRFERRCSTPSISQMN